MKTCFFRRTNAGLLTAACAWLAVHTALHAHSLDPKLFPAMIEALTAELVKSPETDLFIQRGEIFVHQKEWKKAEADFAAAAKLDPQRIVINLLRGRALLEAGDPGRARPLLDRYLEQKSSQPEPWFLRGQISAAMGRGDLARADYAEGFRRASEPGVEQLTEWRRLLAALPDTKPAEVLAILDPAISHLHFAPVLVDFAIELEMARGNYDAALARIDAALPQRRWQGPLLALRGDVLARAGQRPAAVSAYRAALEAIEKLPERNRTVADVQKLARETNAALTRLAAN
jgi:predicted Zn-dependent protease